VVGRGPRRSPTEMDLPERKLCADHVSLHCRQFLTFNSRPTAL
jgi:hypothetical protein